MATTSLDRLPDDLILDIIEHLNRAQDIANLSSSSRRFHDFVRHDGWRAFTKASFPSLMIPCNDATQWDTMANRITYLDRCWEKRSFLIHEFQEQHKRGSRSTSLPTRQSVSFHPVLDARLLSSSGRELVVWGAGENLVAKLGPTSAGGGGEDTWYSLNGHECGFSSGFDDVTAVSVVDRKADPELLVARANGDLQLVNASGDGFGKLTQSLLSAEEVCQPRTNTYISSHGGGSRRRSSISSSTYHNSNASENGSATSRKSTGQSVITWTEWNSSSNVVASCRNSKLTLHHLNNVDEPYLRPLSSYDLSQDSAADDISLVRSAKFMSRDTVTCALGGTITPIRYGKILPTGLKFFNVANNRDSLAYLESLTDVTVDQKTTVRAIETVGQGLSESLLLSAWDDGTYRLNDIRTPSPHDAVYRDRWDIYEAGSSLLVYGTQRFVAGSNTSSSLRFFDFRKPKPYHYTDGLPCSSDAPCPNPPRERGQGWEPPQYVEVCHDNYSSHERSCRWHSESREDYWRPDTTLHLGSTRYDRVHALAKASDVSDVFYCGLQGLVMEMKLKLAEDVTLKDVRRTAPSGWQAGRPRGKVAVVETGVAICRENEWELQNSGYPELWYQLREEPPTVCVPRSVSRSRYDKAYRHHTEVPPGDYRER